MTTLDLPQQDHMKRVVLGNVLNSLDGCPQPYDSMVDVLLPANPPSLFAVFDQTEIDPTDKRNVHPSELRRIQVPYVRCLNPDGTMKMTTSSDGSGVPVPYPLDRMVRELADFGDRDGRLPSGGLRWKLFGSAH